MKTDIRNLVMMVAKSIYVFMYHRINKHTQYGNVAVICRTIGITIKQTRM